MTARGYLIAALAACVLAASAIGSEAGPAGAELSTFGYGNARLGASPGAAGIAPVTARRLAVAWRVSVGGAITGQPLIADHVRVGRRTRDLVIVGTEHGWIDALDAHSGAVLWRARVGTRRITPDCEASPDGIFGITGTPVIDRRAGRLYAVDVNGRAWARRLGDGRVVRGWPVRVHARGAEFVWGALAISRGWLYVPIASLCDSGHYSGGVSAVELRDPRRARRWRTTAGTGAYAGGVWGWGGVSVDDRTGEVFAASGNSIGTAGEDAGRSESVVRLSAGLRVEQSNDPLRPPFAVTDRDFGTTPVLIGARGCPPQLVAINKDGELFLYDRAHVSAGPLERLRVAASSPAAIPLYGMPAFDPASRTLVLVSPTTPAGSRLRAGVQAFALTDSCRLALKWQARFDPPDAGSAPTIAGRVVYIGSGRNGRLRAFGLDDGQPLFARSVSRRAIFAAPAVDRGAVFVGDWSGRLTALRPIAAHAFTRRSHRIIKLWQIGRFADSCSVVSPDAAGLGATDDVGASCTTRHPH